MWTHDHWIPFRSALTDWAIRQWVQLALRANFLQLLQFNFLVQCSRSISVFPFLRNELTSMVFPTEGFLELAIENALIGIRSQDHIISFRGPNWLTYQPIGSTCSQSQLCAATPISSLRSVLMFYSVFAFVRRHICFKPSLALIITIVAERIDTYGIQHWNISRSSYRMLTCFRFKPTTTEFRSDALIEWALRRWVQLALRVNPVQLL